MPADWIEIRTVPSDPLCPRTGRLVLTKPSVRVLADLIWDYKKTMGEWPTIDQVQDAIERFQKGES